MPAKSTREFAADKRLQAIMNELIDATNQLLKENNRPYDTTAIIQQLEQPIKTIAAILKTRHWEPANRTNLIAARNAAAAQKMTARNDYYRAITENRPENEINELRATENAANETEQGLTAAIRALDTGF